MGTLSCADGEWQVDNDVTTNDELLTAVHSHLHPRARAQARFVPTVPPLATTPSKRFSRITRISSSGETSKLSDRRIGSTNDGNSFVFSSFAASFERQTLHALASLEQEVKRIECDGVMAATRVLEKTERRPALGVQRDYLAVAHHIVRKAEECLLNFSTPVAWVFAIA